MINLEKTSGLKLSYDLKLNKLISKSLIIPKADIRTIDDVRHVLLDKKIKSPKNLYYMYRGIHLKHHEDIFKIHKMRWDVTVVPPALIGKEFVKTKGHHHKGIEVYEVLYGEALYIFENEKEFLVYHAKAGTRVYVPYEFWHVTINNTNKPLIMANLMPDEVPSNYKDVERKNGMAYYYIKGNKFVSNNYYKKLPKLIKLKAKNFKTPIYQEFIKAPYKFNLRK